MIAKFNTKDSTRDYFQYVRKHALLLITLGVVFLIAGLTAGICTLIFVEGVAGGVILLIAGVFCGAVLIVYGLYGLKRQLLSNTLITSLEDNMTIFEEDKFVVLQLGRGIKVEKHYDYMHVQRVIEDDDAYYIEMKDNTLVLCTKASLLEGSLDELTKVFAAEFGKDFVDRRKIRNFGKYTPDSAIESKTVAAIDEASTAAGADSEREEVIEVSADEIEEIVIDENSAESAEVSDDEKTEK